MDHATLVNVVHISELLGTAVESPPELTASTGLGVLDDLVGGFRAGQLWVLTGAPGQGCTTLLTQWAGDLAVAHGWLTALVCPREDATDVTARLIAGTGRIPLSQLHNQPPAADDADRTAFAKEALRTSKLSVHTGPGVGIPAWHDMAPQPRALLVDDIDLATVGDGPPLLRAVAENGALVAAVMPRHLLVAGPQADSDLEPHWARAADLILEIRSVGLRSDGRAVEAGEAHLTALKHRGGPLFEQHLHNLCWRARFEDQRQPASGAAMANPKRDRQVTERP